MEIFTWLTESGFVSVTGQNVTRIRDGGVVQERANGPLPAVHSARGSLSFRFRTRGNGHGPVSWCKLSYRCNFSFNSWPLVGGCDNTEFARWTRLFNSLTSIVILRLSLQQILYIIYKICCNCDSSFSKTTIFHTNLQTFAE